MTKSGFIRCIAIAALGLALAPTTVFARNFWVSSAGGRLCTHSNLQSAIDAAQGDTEDDQIFLVGSGPFIGPFTIFSGDLTIVGGVPSCGSTTSTARSTLQTPSGQRPLSIILGRAWEKVTLRRLVITTNSGTLNAPGGGLWFASSASPRGELVLDDSRVVNNATLSDGGGIFVSGGILSLTGTSVVSGNTAFNGGGISAVNDAVININSSVVTANAAWADGGGIHALDADLRIGDFGSGLPSSVDNNIAGIDGGGIYADGSAVNVGRVARVLIKANQARRGGGIFLEENVGMRLDLAELHLNKAGEAGGGVYLGPDVWLTTEEIQSPEDGFPFFTDNRAPDGASIFADGALSWVGLRAGTFRGHDTSKSGAALVAASNGAGLYFRGITVFGNRAPELFAIKGGAGLTLLHTSIAANEVGRLVRWDGSGPGVQVISSAFSETEPFFSGLPTPQVLPQLTCTVTHFKSLLQGLPPGTDLSGVLIADPRFEAPERGDLHARPASPVIDLCPYSDGGGIEISRGYDRDGDFRGFDDPLRPNPEDRTHDAGADEVVAIVWDDFESGNLSRWNLIDSPPPGSGGSSVQVSTAARLGPPSSQRGLQLTLVDPNVQTANAAYIWASPAQTTSNQDRLNGSFFLDPQSLTMSTADGLNRLRLVRFYDEDSFATRLAFTLVRAAADRWYLEVLFWPNAVGNPVVAGSAYLACAGTPCGNPADWRNNRIEFEWRDGDPGRLTMWRTRYLNGLPDATGRVQMLSVNLPVPGGLQLNEVSIGTFGTTSQPAGCFGEVYFDEVSFTR